MTIYCEKHRAINTATSFLYSVSIERKKKSNGMKRMVDKEGMNIS